ncbi:TetR/AcrR family transcriptional regulator [Microbacterium sp. KUDC0406]|uniref:TetR/AcrR family transcriptional regulator n=1 Tax=Microbacterium sp. KUDC0406 TaxID=2909588 RepID=UPI001F460C6C|nr:TetR/AcrR family transcriptional regulator [Microbacterium sp. KUDC0406]UJP10337.1 TetR/AcrR family transcriptional regulator [Microbacterium sp. KUDC0406]
MADPAPPARERFLDAALLVMRERGIANATTKLIAQRAGLSEALLYKNFDDKQHLFLCVLEERTPRVRFDPDAAGSEDLLEALMTLTEQLMAFFTSTFPLAASVFGSPDLLAQHRDGVTAQGKGPAEAVTEVRRFLDAERRAGRIRRDADTTAAARTLVGAAFHQGFLAAFSGEDDVPGSRRVAAGIAGVLLPALSAED